MPSLRSRTAGHVYLIQENISCHAEIQHPEVNVLELPPNTTGILQPLDKGATVQVKRRYKTRMAQRVINNLDAVIASGRPAPRVPRGGGVDQRRQAYLWDAAHIIAEEWEKVIAVQVANCWLTAEVLPNEVVSKVRREVHGVVPVADSVHTNVSEVVTLVAYSRLGNDFKGVSESERSRVGEQWFAAENDVEELDKMVDVALGEGMEEWEE